MMTHLNLATKNDHIWAFVSLVDGVMFQEGDVSVMHVYMEVHVHVYSQVGILLNVFTTLAFSVILYFMSLW